jgi:hypothetical protein
LNRTPASASNRKTWTWSAWVKRSSLANAALFSAGTADNARTLLYFDATNGQLYFFNSASGTVTGIVTSAYYRDVSAWYHVVLSIDTTQATAGNRAKIYVNGVEQVVSTYVGAISLNADLFVNATNAHGIGAQAFGTAIYSNGYLTEINFIDGSALTPTSFGEFNSDTGVWQPIKYIGTYGTNGFYLNFSDNTSTTTLGDDFSGNGNDWTTNNFSVTAGAGNDSLVDSPTRYGTDTGAGGEVRGNYATLNPLHPSGGTRTFANGNLEVTGGALNNNSTELANWQLTSGKWYFEATVGAIGTASITAVGTNAILYQGNGSFFPSGSGASYTTNDVIGVAIDIGAGTVQFYKNGVSQGTVNGTAGASATPAFALGGAATAPKWIANFGQRAFAYTAPSGFKALVTTNLPTPTIEDGSQYFDVALVTGSASVDQVITTSFAPDFLWSKCRNDTIQHGLYDTVRGGNKYLSSNSTAAEVATTGSVVTFTSSGASLQAGGSIINDASRTYVDWLWKANGAGVSNTDGTITSTVSVNTTSGFSIVTYTGTGSAATVGHGLGVAPRMFIVKERNASGDDWYVYHASLGAANTVFLNTTSASTAGGSAAWNSTAPTSNVFSLGTSLGVNQNTNTYVAYCFAEVPGYSAFGSVTGNGSADGPFVFVNFRPAFVMLKRTDSTSNWTILDFTRLGYNVDNNPLFPNLSNAEGTTDLADLLSNGFKLRSTDASVNASGGTYIYAAFCSNPFVYSLAR